LKYYSECRRVPYVDAQTIKLAACWELERICRAHQKFQLFISGIPVLLFSNRTKFVLAAMLEVDDFILKSGSLYFSLKVAERGFEYIIVVVMNRRHEILRMAGKQFHINRQDRMTLFANVLTELSSCYRRPSV
jgi:hypothetical protein